MKGRDVMNFFPLCLLLLLQETSTGAFDDLGKLLLGGTVSAILLAVGFTVVRLRMRDKRPPTSDFLSISAIETKTPAE
jgi:hypothetical protein